VSSGRTAARSIQLVTFLSSWYNVGAVVLAQMSWGLWRHVRREDFPTYHRAWFVGMRPTIWPMAGVAGIGALLQLRWRPRGVPRSQALLGALLQIANFVLTGAWWARWQARLDQVWLAEGELNPLYTRLLRSHWLRVSLIVAFAVLQVVEAIESTEKPLQDD
jgi:hypothetical protein